MPAGTKNGAAQPAHHSLEDNCEGVSYAAPASVQDAVRSSPREHIVSVIAVTFPAGDCRGQERRPAMRCSRGGTPGKEGPGSCTTCYTQHEGKGSMASTASCTDCHNGPFYPTESIPLAMLILGTSTLQLQAQLTAPHQPRPDPGGVQQNIAARSSPHECTPAAAGGEDGQQAAARVTDRPPPSG
jgi:hypothetical protein